MTNVTVQGVRLLSYFVTLTSNMTSRYRYRACRALKQVLVRSCLFQNELSRNDVSWLLFSCNAILAPQSSCRAKSTYQGRT